MNYKFFLLYITCCLFFCNSFGQKNTAVDVQHYQFKIELSDQSDTIKGEAIISIKFLQAVQNFSLDLQSISKGKGMQLYTATADVPVSVKHENDKIFFSLNTPAKKNEVISFTINYGGIPTNGLIISKNKYGNRTFFADNWPDRAHHWIPCVDDVADKAPVEFDVIAPLHYQVISNGLQVEETNLPGNKKLTRYSEKIALPTKVMVIGAADFAVNYSGMVNCVPVYSWVYPEDKKEGFYDYAMATDILKWFIKNVGPYAYEKLANVQSKTIFGGMENASAIFYSENSIDGKRTSESLLAHEIAHQWFGNMTTEKSFAHLWLSEGFATCMTILYMKDKYGKDTAISMLNEDRAQVIAFSKKVNTPVVDTATKNYMELLNANSYQKGGWVLHMLNQQLGDSIFWESIRKYYATYAGKNADTDDLRSIFEEVSGKNLQQFFKQWLYTSELPDLDLQWNYNERNKKLTVTITQKQDYLFQLPLTLSFHFADGKGMDKMVHLTKQTETFTFSPGKKPVEIITDPNTALLFIGNIRQAL